MLFVPGVDTRQGNWVVLLKIDILSNERSVAIECLREINSRLSNFSFVTSLSRLRPGKLEPIEATALVGFSARFFKGALTSKRDYFPHATRFNITQPVPPCLRRMRAREDNRFAELCTDELIAAKESDLIIVFESLEHEAGNAAVKELQAMEERKKVNLKRVYKGFLPQDGKSFLGFKEGISNLQDLRSQNPEAYRRFIYVHDGEAGSPDFDGGSYLVLRKYILHLDKWFSDSLCIKDNKGKEYFNSDARELAIGRSLDNLVIECETGALLASSYDEGQAIYAFKESHIRKANPRGSGATNFGAPVLVKDARILRRGFSTVDIEPSTGKTKYGLLFLCFQSDIQKRGFEFIHNEWLMSNFLGGKDRLLDPKSGVTEPIDGCYYFCPPSSVFPGDVFF